MLRNTISLFLSLMLVIGLAACGQPEVSLAEGRNASTVSVHTSDASSSGSEIHTDDQTGSDRTDSEAASIEPGRAVSGESTDVVSRQTASRVNSQTTASALSSRETQASVLSSSVGVPSVESEAPITSMIEQEEWLTFDSTEQLLAFVQEDPRGKQLPLVRDRIDASAAFLMIPRSTWDELRLCSIEASTEEPWIVFDFCTSRSDVPYENELFSISVFSQLPTDAASRWPDNAPSGEYKGIFYQYLDGSDGKGTEPKQFASAWFEWNNYQVQIVSYWASGQKPWNNAYFDYFTFEKVAF